MVDVGHRGKFVDNIDVQQHVYRHVEVDLGNKQCCWTHAKICEYIKLAKLDIWCCDPRGGAPRYSVLGGSWAVLFRLIGTFMNLLPDRSVLRAHTILYREFRELCGYYRTLVRPCTHGADDGDGCGYLKELQCCPKKYGLHSSMSAFVRMLDGCRSGYDGYEIVRGNRDEALGAIILRSDGAIPKVTPMQGKDMFFVWHPQIEEMLLDWVSDRILSRLQQMTGCFDVEQLQFKQNLWEMTSGHVILALEKLAFGKPVFEVHIRSGRIEIS